MGGLMNVTGDPEGGPAKVGVAMTDLMTALYAHGAIMAALMQREKTGRGQKIDCNLLSTQVMIVIKMMIMMMMIMQPALHTGVRHDPPGRQLAQCWTDF